MKAIPHLLALAVLLVTAAAAPSAVNYQGRFTNTAGIPQPGIQTMSLKIHNAATDGIVIYSENIGNVTINANGVYGFQWGANGAGTPPNLATALAASTEQWLELTIGGVTQIPRQKILAVPFALMANALPDGAVSSAMIADGAVGLSKITGLGSAATANAEDFTSPPGPYADNSAALAAGVGVNQIYRKPNGAIGWVYLRADALAYQEATRISNAEALRVSAFFEGLESLGLNDELLDGAVYREKANIDSGTTLYSLRGLSNLTMMNSPTRKRNGVYFDGVNQYANGNIANTTGARTFMAIHTGNLSNAATDERPVFSLRNGTSLTSMNESISGPNMQRYCYAGVALRNSLISGAIRNTTTFTVDSIRDDALAGVASFGGRRLPLFGTTYSRGTTQGEPLHTLTNLRICLNANATLSTFYSHTERMVPGWLLFNRVLTDDEENDVNTLLGASIFPKWKTLWEGDSISNDVSGRAGDKGMWAGANVAHMMVWAGGETSAEGVAQLGTATGLNTTNLAADMPCVVDVSFGANDLGNFSSGARSVAVIHANLRTIWAYAKATNPAAVVCAHTVLQSSYITAQGRESDRDALNALIRADAGVLYDVLQDRDAWSFAATVSRPVYNDLSLFRDDGGRVHLNLGVGKGAGLLATYMSSNLEGAVAIP